MNDQTKPAGRPANSRPLNEMIRADTSKGTPSRDIPEHLTKHYKQDGNVYKSAYHENKIEFVDRGNRMHAYFPISTFTVRSMTEIAEARGWKELEVTGSAPFKQSAYIEAASRGMGVKGYEPTPKDADILQRREERKASEQNPMVQAFLKAETGKDRTAAVKEFPALKEAFKADAAAKAVAAEKIDSKKAAENFVGRFRDSIAIALHTGRAIPNIPVAQDKAQEAAPASDKSQGRSR